MRTIRLIVEYDGTDFAGWFAAGVQPGLRTIQAEIEAALLSLTQEPIRVRYSSRTDAGVHARGQVVAFDVERDDIPLHGFERGLSSKLPNSIVIRRAEAAEPGWNPRQTARGKRYRYTYWNDRQPAAIERNFTWWVREKLNVDAMHAAAQVLVGAHDFSSFRATGCVARHARRTIYQIEVARGSWSRVHLTIVGNAFVKNMVRIIAGTLRDVGGGRRSVEDLRRILEAKDRTQAGQTAPGRGLCLEEVIYDDRLPPRPERPAVAD